MMILTHYLTVFDVANERVKQDEKTADEAVGNLVIKIVLKDQSVRQMLSVVHFTFCGCHQVRETFST